MSSPFNVVSNQKIMQIRPFEAADGTLTIWGSQWVFQENAELGKTNK
jgi:hypothetical protein